MKALMLRGAALPVIEEMLQELRPNLQAHNHSAAFAAAKLTKAARKHGSGPEDRACMALAIWLGIPHCAS